MSIETEYMDAKLIFWVFFLSLLMACRTGEQQTGNDFQSDSPLFYEGLAKLDQRMAEKDYIVVIPGSGCGGCIGQATNYFLTHGDSVAFDWAVIFTGIVDKKQLKINVGNSFLAHPNVWIDEKNIFRTREISSIYPLLIKLEQAQIKSVEIFDVPLFEEMLAGKNT
ncbi:MAG: hypothetical protein AAFP89_22765 [Bacteroidota bacterium]